MWVRGQDWSHFLPFLQTNKWNWRCGLDWNHDDKSFFVLMFMFVCLESQGQVHMAAQKCLKQSNYVRLSLNQVVYWQAFDKQWIICSGRLVWFVRNMGGSKKLEDIGRKLQIFWLSQRTRRSCSERERGGSWQYTGESDNQTISPHTVWWQVAAHHTSSLRSHRRFWHLVNLNTTQKKIWFQTSTHPCIQRFLGFDF